MESLIHSFSVPWYIWMGLGAFITLFIVKPNFRQETDAFLAHLLGMRPKRGNRRDEPNE